MSRHEKEYQNGSHHWNEPTKDMGLELGKEHSFQNYCHLLESQILGDCQIGKRYIQEISALYGLRAFFLFRNHRRELTFKLLGDL